MINKILVIIFLAKILFLNSLIKKKA
jgi:hypothetical protein